VFNAITKCAAKCHVAVQNMGIHRFIRLLRLCAATFQSFVDLKSHTVLPETDIASSPWLLQESFNTLCATTIIVVDVGVKNLGSNPDEKKKMMHGVLDLLLLVLTSPQSSVTHLRAVGGVIQILELDVDLFLEVAGATLQHWARIVLSLMNSVSLSVRSIAVDFVVSLLGSTFQAHGSIDSVLIVFATVLPEVVAREIALCSVSGHISSADDIAKSVWPMRRAIADLGEANPTDDDRVDTQLSPVLSAFCRACQAIIDGVLIELSLRGDDFLVVGAEVHRNDGPEVVFDADEESLLEASSFFVAETAPMQKIRWLQTLKSLHVTKSNWIEAGECALLCAQVVCESFPHLHVIWRPNRFALWSDNHRSIWLDIVGKDMGHPDRGNAEVMSFAEHFLEPVDVLKSPTTLPLGKLSPLTVSAMCDVLERTIDEAVTLYSKDIGMPYCRLEPILSAVMRVVEDHSRQRVNAATFRSPASLPWTRHLQEEAKLQRVLASTSERMSTLLSVAADIHTDSLRPLNFIVIRLFGAKPSRFKESTTLPTFLEWEKPCVCRVPNSLAERFDTAEMTVDACLEFIKPFVSSLRFMRGDGNVFVETEPHRTEDEIEEGKTYLEVFPVSLTESRAVNAQYERQAFSPPERGDPRRNRCCLHIPWCALATKCFAHNRYCFHEIHVGWLLTVSVPKDAKE
jgi:Dock homology region 2